MQTENTPNFYSVIMFLAPSIIGFVGVIVGYWMIDGHKKSSEKRDLYKRLFIFYKSRTERLKSLEGNFLTEWKEEDLDIARSSYLAELYLIASQEVIEVERDFYKALWSRECSFRLQRKNYKDGKSPYSVNLGKGTYENMAYTQALLKKEWQLFDQKFNSLLNAIRTDIGTVDNIFISWNAEMPSGATLDVMASIDDDPETAEMLLRGRIADEKARDGALPLELTLFVSPRFYENGLGVSFQPKQRDSLGYEILFLSTDESVNVLFEKIKGYFLEIPGGQIKLMKFSKTKSLWETVALCKKEKIHEIEKNIQEWAIEQRNKLSEASSKKVEKWENCLRAHGIAIPEFKQTS